VPPADAPAPAPGSTRPGRLITFEGGEGAGKSTQLVRLADWLAASGGEVVRTREPGGTPGAEALRALLVEGAADRWLPSTELLLFAAARDDHLRRLVRPALGRGAWVLCDRFTDSTLVYQGAAGGVSAARIGLLDREILEVPRPDLTLLLDIPPADGLRRRAAASGGGGRFEAKGQSFHERVREGFLRLARTEPDRVALIDATPSPERVADAVRAEVARRFGLSTA
jgi:dTMP kinase